MIIFTWLLTFLLVIDCLILVLLVLIQLPKKEAGMGQAFGGSATDALFGAGSGTALTKMTKYTAAIFFALTLVLSVLHTHVSRPAIGDPRERLSKEEKLGLLAPPAAAKKGVSNAVSAAGTAAAGGTNGVTLLSTPTTNAPNTNAPVEKEKK